MPRRAPGRALGRLLALLAVGGASAAPRCGFGRDCPRTYSLLEVNRSALAGDSFNGTRVVSAEQLRNMSAFAAAMCAVRNVKTQRHGGWCYPLPGARGNGGAVPLPRGGAVFMPREHVLPDSPLVALLLELLRVGRTPTLSLNDFGAGVGQYGIALTAAAPAIQYRGYDGGANVEAATAGRLSWFDLARPLALPKADWLISVEVGEHVPNMFEGTLVRNLHAHNCRGLILSWAALRQQGYRHVNCHSAAYVVKLFQGLGYEYDTQLTDRLHRGELPPDFRSPWVPPAAVADWAARRHHLWAAPQWYNRSTGIVNLPWLRKTLHVFRRVTPLRHPECTPPGADE